VGGVNFVVGEEHQQRRLKYLNELLNPKSEPLRKIGFKRNDED
jgi:hypothetical protein